MKWILTQQKCEACNAKAPLATQEELRSPLVSWSNPAVKKDEDRTYFAAGRMGVLASLTLPGLEIHPQVSCGPEKVLVVPFVAVGVVIDCVAAAAP